ncbi:hypothetical protein [Thaumasiovibrio sp. DFM-14]|uniref:hypothetical protein n=1 Tax=Thaumasiovibrio sp. DFM-14 TaxID=3384792 RepID=UPI0039A3D3C2
MSIYQVRNLTQSYKVLEHNPYQRAIEQGDEVLLQRLFNEPVNSRGLKDVWVEESVEFTSHYDTSTLVPDVSVWASFLVLNQKAYVSLRSALESDGEFLPINIDGEPFHVFNVMSFGQEDMTLTKLEIIDGEEAGLLSLKFDEGSVTDKYVFKSLQNGCNQVYCDEKFKQLCIESALRGIDFDLDLLDVFDY